MVETLETRVGGYTSRLTGLVDMVETFKTRVGDTPRAGVYLTNITLSVSLIFPPSSAFFVMIFLQSFCSLIVSTLSVVEVLSSSQSQDPVLSGDPYWAPSTAGAVSSDVKNWNQGSLIASGSLQGPNLWPGNSNLRLSNQGGSDTNTPLDIPKDSALLFDGSDGVTNVAPPTFPNPLRVIFPDGLPQFDPAGAIRWFTEPVKPQCDNGKFAFCCQEGPPGFQQKKDKPPATQERKEEIRRRLRKCRNCKSHWEVNNQYLPYNLLFWPSCKEKTF